MREPSMTRPGGEEGGTAKGPGRLRAMRKALGPILAVLIAGAGVVGYSYWSERSALGGRKYLAHDEADGRAWPEELVHSWWPKDREGIVRPATVAASEARIADDEVVFGVEAGGKARAYQLRAMSAIEQHIVNDMVGGVPVSVLYCDMSDCARAYAGEAGGEPLPIRMAGALDRKMVVKIDGTFYDQDTGERLEGTNRPANTRAGGPPIPFAAQPLVRTTWKEWKRLHPDSDVYAGEAEGPSRSAAPGAR